MTLNKIFNNITANGFDERLLNLTIVGSQLHGTSLTNSDIDIRGIFLPNAESFLVQKDVHHFSCKFEDNGTKYEVVLVSIQHFLTKVLQMECNAVELLFASNTSCNLYKTPEMDIIFEDGKKLLRKDVSSFLGMASAEIKRYKTNKRANSGKDLAHGLRSVYQAQELLDTGSLKYPVKQAEYLKHAKEMNISFDILYEQLHGLLENFHYTKELTTAEKQDLKNKLILSLYGV